jgi:hypothetical protein
MHTTIVQVVSSAGVHQAWSFDAATKAGSVSKAMRFCREGWEIDTTLDYSDFTKVEKINPCDGLTYIKLHAK